MTDPATGNVLLPAEPRPRPLFLPPPLARPGGPQAPDPRACVAAAAGEDDPCQGRVSPSSSRLLPLQALRSPAKHKRKGGPLPSLHPLLAARRTACGSGLDGGFPTPPADPREPQTPIPAVGSGRGPRPPQALTSAGLRSPRACAEPDKWYAMTRDP
nr:proline-rich protein 2-like [Cavia porcellus]